MPTAAALIRRLHSVAEARPLLTSSIGLLLLFIGIASVTFCPSLLGRALGCLLVLLATVALSVSYALKVVVRSLIPRAHYADYAPLYQSEQDLARTPRSITEIENYIFELNERYELISNNIAASVIIRKLNGNIIFCSPYTQVLTGYTPEEIAAAESDDFFETIVVLEDRERYARARQVAAIGEDILVRVRIQHRSGILLWLEARLIPICDEHGEVIAVMIVAIDVTDSLSYQKQIEQQNQDLSDFSYMISHDLKSPIFTIKGMAAVLADDCSDTLGTDGLASLQYIRDAANRLEQLVTSLLEYSALAISTDAEADVPLDSCLNAALADNAELIKQTNAQIDRKGTLPTVRGNELRLYQVFANLITNAIKYRSSERQIKITIRTVAHTPGFITIAVSDNGSGIPARKLDSVFRPFQRAHGSEIEGSGIGLACVKKVIERMGGTVSVESTEGKGSTFLLRFPTLFTEPQQIPHDLERAYRGDTH